MTVKEINKRLKLMKKYQKRLRGIVLIVGAKNSAITIDDIYERLEAMSAYYEEQKIKAIDRAAEEAMENHFAR